jgi:hypothetical protein
MDLKQWRAFTAAVRADLDKITPTGDPDKRHQIGPYRVRDTADAIAVMRATLARTPAAIQAEHLEGAPPCGGFLPLAGVYSRKDRVRGKGPDAVARWHLPTLQKLAGPFAG